jgi:hypothetical protein
MYYLDDGDSLLYFVDYSVDAGKQRDDGTIDFTVAVKRFFFKNPASFFTTEADSSLGSDGFGEGHRSVDCVLSVKGDDRHVRAEIDDGTVTYFRWDNIHMTRSDIIRNWEEIVKVLKKVETTGDYAYRQPVLNGAGDTAPTAGSRGFLAGHENYTGDKVATTTYSKSISIKRREDAEIQIPFIGGHQLPFKGYETIRLKAVTPNISE